MSSVGQKNGGLRLDWSLTSSSCRRPVSCFIHDSHEREKSSAALRLLTSRIACARERERIYV